MFVLVGMQDWKSLVRRMWELRSIYSLCLQWSTLSNLIKWEEHVTFCFSLWRITCLRLMDWEGLIAMQIVEQKSEVSSIRLSIIQSKMPVIIMAGANRSNVLEIDSLCTKEVATAVTTEILNAVILQNSI